MRTLCFLSFLLGCFHIQAQTIGALDATYGVNGYRIVNMGFLDCEVYCQEVQADGKLIVAGSSVIYSGTSYDYYAFMIRFTADGALDVSFGNDGLVLKAAGNYFTHVVVKIKPDGKILLGGKSFLSQYNQNGFLDTSFGNNGSVYPVFHAVTDYPITVYDIGFQSDQSIIILGGCASNPSNKTVFVYKYDANGVHFPAFGSALNHNKQPNRLIVQDDDTITFTTTLSFSTDYSMYVLALDANGVPGPVQLISNAKLNCILKSGGKYILNYSSTLNANVYTSRYNAVSNIDTAFANNGQASIFPASVKINEVDDKLVFLQNNDFAVTFYRGNSDGTLDLSFSNSGILNLPDLAGKYAADFDIVNGNFFISGNTDNTTNNRNIFIAKAFYQNPLGVTDVSQDYIKIYPNPTSDYVSFENQKTIEKVKIVNLQGQIVISKEIAQNQVLDVKDLAAGVYWIKFENRKALKLIKK